SASSPAISNTSATNSTPSLRKRLRFASQRVAAIKANPSRIYWHSTPSVHAAHALFRAALHETSIRCVEQGSRKTVREQFPPRCEFVLVKPVSARRIGNLTIRILAGAFHP